MNKTLTLLIKYKDITLGIHYCDKAPDNYLRDVSKLTFDKLVKERKINEKDVLININMQSKIPTIIIISENENKYDYMIELIKMHTLLSEVYNSKSFRNFKYESMQINHSFYQIKSYELYSNIDTNVELIYAFKEIMVLILFDDIANKNKIIRLNNKKFI